MSDVSDFFHTTVGDLRAALEAFPDDATILLDIDEDGEFCIPRKVLIVRWSEEEENSVVVAIGDDLEAFGLISWPPVIPEPDPCPECVRRGPCPECDRRQREMLARFGFFTEEPTDEKTR